MVEPNPRLLCGFDQVPGKAAFSRVFTFLSEQELFERTLDGIVGMAHKDLVVSCKPGLNGDTGEGKGC
ncbi:MAG: hypothetical protein LBK66_05235 [Spirochaetaceae bacterium]|nr:hypothetical protein [Spirochaetaceae bacterium]